MIKSHLEAFMSVADTKAEDLGWGMNAATLIESHAIVHVTSTQGVPGSTINHSFRVDGYVADMEEVAALLGDKVEL